MADIVSDSSPLQYLYQTDLLELLPARYGPVLVRRGAEAGWGTIAATVV